MKLPLIRLAVIGALMVAADYVAPAHANDAAPQGYAEACAAHPLAIECGGPAPVGGVEAIAVLERTNERVNARIEYVADEKHYGRPEVWEDPTDGKAVCHGYALAKLHELVAAGYPIADLRLAVGRLSTGEWHVVLVARFEGADYVLDNNTPHGEARVQRAVSYPGIKWNRIQSTGGSQDWIAYSGE